ncbi:hypothetical protein EVAR_84959_1 [Eumeta japonica]|uniref:Uncharacterized protein n=1 Tax=Eumeta variegata TaxID=151549 RepID=A0A4C1VHX5_EUMVA|nr:hypothetical protein EVAR_84959_1 [Eumeta japonica]
MRSIYRFAAVPYRPPLALGLLLVKSAVLSLLVQDPRAIRHNLFSHKRNLMFSVVSYVLRIPVRLWSLPSDTWAASAIPEPIVISEPNVDESIEFESVKPVSCNSEDSCVAEDVSNNITDDDEDDDDSVGQYHDWLNDENSNNCYDDCDD